MQYTTRKTEVNTTRKTFFWNKNYDRNILVTN